jgi:hypothetical protein
MKKTHAHDVTTRRLRTMTSLKDSMTSSKGMFVFAGKKKRNKDNFKSGGTWPRARGGPIIEQGTGEFPKKNTKI